MMKDLPWEADAKARGVCAPHNEKLPCAICEGQKKADKKISDEIMLRGAALRCGIAADPRVLQRERDAYRAALRAIYEVWANTEGGIPDSPDAVYWRERTRDMRDIASDALGLGKPYEPTAIPAASGPDTLTPTKMLMYAAVMSAAANGDPSIKSTRPSQDALLAAATYLAKGSRVIEAAMDLVAAKWFGLPVDNDPEAPGRHQTVTGNTLSVLLSEWRR